jgi:ribose transport system substrate-binding protein
VVAGLEKVAAQGSGISLSTASDAWREACLQKGELIMRQRLLVFLCLLATIGGGTVAQTAKDMADRRTVTIGMIGKIAENPVFIASHTGARVAAKELGARYNVQILIDWQTPKVENVEEQAAAMDRFSRSGVQGIAIACSDANYLAQVIDRTVDKGMPVMCFDSDAPKSKRFAYCGADDTEFGRMLVRELASELKGKGTIAVLAGNRHALNLQRRLQGIKDELKNYPQMLLPADNVYHNLDIPEQAAAVANRIQKEKPFIAGWIFITSSALQVKNGLKWNPGDVKAVAGNAVPAELEFIKSGHVQALAGVNCYQMGYKTVEILLDRILNNRTPRNPIIYTRLTPVTKNNVEDWSIKWKMWLVKEAAYR